MGSQYQTNTDGDSVCTGPFNSQVQLFRSKSHSAADGRDAQTQNWFSGTRAVVLILFFCCFVLFFAGLSVTAIYWSTRCTNITDKINDSHDTLLGQLNVLNETLRNYTAELEDVKKEKKLMREHLKLTNESLGDIKEEKRRIEEQLKVNKEERLVLQRKIQLMNESLEEVKEEHIRIQDNLNQQREEGIRLQRTIQQLNESLASCSGNLDQLTETQKTTDGQLRAMISVIGDDVHHVNTTCIKNTQELVKINTGQVSLRNDVSANQRRLSQVEDEQRSMSAKGQYASNGAHCLNAQLKFTFLILLPFMVRI